MKKVLFVAGRMVHGGLEIMLMNFFRNIDSSKVKIDFMLHHPEAGAFDEEIRQSGSNIYIMPRIVPKNVFKYIISVNKFFSEHKGEYDVVHGHLTSVGVIYLTIAKLHGVKTRIIHAHYANVEGNHYEKLERIMLKPLKYCANWYFACSEKAGRFCFGNKIVENKNLFRVIHNGIDVKKFSYDENIRNDVREELDFVNKYVILHVGRFESEKNHRFMLEMMSKYKKDDVILALVGSGTLENDIKKLAEELCLSDKIHFFGLRNDVYKIMQGADVFILPSVFEGLPVVGIESQGSGLPCIFSDTVTKEVDISGNCSFISTSNVDSWIEKIEELRTFNRKKTDQVIKDGGYDIAREANVLENFYLSC